MISIVKFLSENDLELVKEISIIPLMKKVLSLNNIHKLYLNTSSFSNNIKNVKKKKEEEVVLKMCKACLAFTVFMYNLKKCFK